MSHATDEAQLPKVSNLQRTANRVRQRLRPKHPTDLEFEIAKNHIPSDFCQDLHRKGNRHLLLTSPLQLSLLCKSKIWFIDGTFKVVREPFVQLVSIHIYIKTGETAKQITGLSWMLTPSSSHQTIMLEEIVVDFECALWNALRKSLPDIPVQYMDSGFIGCRWCTKGLTNMGYAQHM